MHQFLFLIIGVLAIAINIQWYKIKSILSEHGFKVTYFYGHFKDLPNFKKLIDKTENPAQKASYSRMLWRLLICVLMSIILAVIYFTNL